MSPITSNPQVRHRPTMFALILALAILVGFGWYYAARSARQLANNSADSASDSLGATTTSSGLATSKALAIVTGTVASIDGTALSVNDGSSTWSFVLKNSTSVRKLTEHNGSVTTQSAEQATITKNQRVSVTIDSDSLSTPQPVAGVDILIQQ